MSNSEATDIRCGRCSTDLTPTKDEPNCPACGSGSRNVHVHEEVRLKESVGVKVRGDGATGRAALEFRAGDDLTRGTNEWVTLERRIDRENDRYYGGSLTTQETSSVRSTSRFLNIKAAAGLSSPATTTETASPRNYR